MTAVRPATDTVAFVDTYAAIYRDLFQDVRSFDHFTRLHLGRISDVAHTSLPALSRVIGWIPSRSITSAQRRLGRNAVSAAPP